MKAASVLFLCCLPLLGFTVTPPPGIRGNPSITGRKGSMLVVGKVSISAPQNWGIGEMASGQANGYFHLFPKDGGVGCSVLYDKFENEQRAKEEMERLSGTCLNAKPISGGFEAEVEGALYSCRAEGSYILQTWYVVPLITDKVIGDWEKLKLCASVAEERTIPNKDVYSKVEEIPYQGWLCNHPNNKLHVKFESNFVKTAKPSTDPSTSYFLQIGDMNSSGYFYIKWDQKNLDARTPFDNHLNEMKAEILSFEKDQRFERETIFDEKQGFGYLRGDPYCLISLPGDGFLFGFALKRTYRFRDYSINDYIRRVSWQID